MNKVFCLENLQSNITDNYSNMLVYSESEQSFMSECLDSLIEMNTAYREGTKILCRAIMESGNDIDIIHESVGSFLTKVKDVLVKFFNLLKKLLERFNIMIHKMISSDKFLMSHKKDLVGFDSSNEFEINGYEFTIDPDVPVANALAAFNEDFLKINFDIKDGQIVKDCIKNQYKAFMAKIENGLYDEFRAEVIKEDGYITKEDFDKELFQVFRNGTDTISVINIDATKVSDAALRFETYKDMEKNIKKLKESIEREYKSIEKHITRMANAIKSGDNSKILSVDIDSDYANIDTFKATVDDKQYLDLLIKAKSNQIIEMSNIHAIAFSAKLDALKDCYKQDKKILYSALNKVAKDR